MTTLTNSQGRVLNYTDEFIETILLQLNSSNNYYTAGDDDTIFSKICSTKVSLLGYTYHINRTILHNYTINENTINEYGLEFIFNNTSNEYTLQGVYNANSYIGSITDLSQVYLAIYDTTVSPQTYTGSENLDITNNEISLNFQLKINDEIVLHPRLNGYFELHAGTSGITLLRNIVDGSLPLLSISLPLLSPCSPHCSPQCSSHCSSLSLSLSVPSHCSPHCSSTFHIHLCSPPPLV